jgi:predicted RNase H-like nuclease
MLFVGIDSGWVSQPSGVAILVADPHGQLQLRALDRLPDNAAVLAWLDEQIGSRPALLAIDAPLVIPNATGIRNCEREINAQFRRMHAGCHAANQGRPFFEPLRRFVRELQSRGFQLDGIEAGGSGRHAVEVHPHAATVRLFDLERIVKYKKGRIEARKRELERYRSLLATLFSWDLPAVPQKGKDLKAVEDKLDAINAAYVGALLWKFGEEAVERFGEYQQGAILVPKRNSRWVIGSKAEPSSFISGHVSEPS